MIYRIVTTAAFVASTFLLCLPAQAQTNSTGQGTSSNSSSMGSMGSGAQNGSGMNNSGLNGANSSDRSNSGRGQSGNAVAQSGMNDQMNRSAGKRGEMNEQQITECLNNAAANRQPLGSCSR